MKEESGIAEKESVMWVVTCGHRMVGIFDSSREAMDWVEEQRKNESWMTLDYWPGQHEIGNHWVVKGIHKR